MSPICFSKELLDTNLQLTLNSTIRLWSVNLHGIQIGGLRLWRFYPPTIRIRSHRGVLDSKEVNCWAVVYKSGHQDCHQLSACTTHADIGQQMGMVHNGSKSLGPSVMAADGMGC